MLLNTNLYGFDKKEIKNTLMEGEILTLDDMDKYVSQLEPMYTIFDEKIPVIDSSSFCKKLNSPICIIVRTYSNKYYIIVNSLFTNYLTEKEQVVLLCHEYGHYLDMKDDLEFESELESEARADACSVRYCGFDLTIETMKKVDTLVSLAFDYDLELDDFTKARLEILEYHKERFEKENRA